MTPLKTCYLDLDGVLVNFTKGVLAFHKKEIPYSEISWDFDKKVGLEPAEFWDPLGYDFWLGLEWTKEGREILATVEARFGDSVAIITSPPKTAGAVQGKLDWIAREMPRYTRRVFVGARKELLAASDKLLIDDREQNILEFEKAGGQGFLVPRPWNSQAAEEEFLVQNLADRLWLGL